MKKYSILIIVFLISFLTSCDKNEYEITKNPGSSYLRMWAMQSCSTSFDIINETSEEWGDRVIDTLESKNFIIKSYHLGYFKMQPFIGCGNCLRTGDYVDIKVPTNQVNDLKKLGFSEE